MTGLASTLPRVYEEVQERLRTQLGTRWKAGERLPPIKDLAQQLGAGKGATHLAVRGLVARGLLQSRPRRGTFVSRSAGSADAGPARAEHAALAGKSLSVLWGGPERETFAFGAVEALLHLAAGAGAAARADVFGPRMGAALAAHAEADAIVVVNPYTQPLMSRPGQPLLLISTAMENLVAMTGGYDVVSVDSEQGGYLAGHHLRQEGVRQVCFVGCPPPPAMDQTLPWDYTSGTRLRGLEQGWGAAVPAAQRLCAPKYRPDDGARAFAGYLALSPRPDGVFCASDDLAVGFALAAMSHGLEPGRDFQLVGFDGQLRGRQLSCGPLTTIVVPMRQMGAVAADLLAQRLAQPSAPVRRLFLGCRLSAGGTTGGHTSTAPSSSASFTSSA